MNARAVRLTTSRYLELSTLVGLMESPRPENLGPSLEPIDTEGVSG
jgi:hypothetical protein